jgi:hypothetical protein
MPGAEAFERLFRRARRQVRMRRAAGTTLTGLAVGSVVGSGLAFALWVAGRTGAPLAAAASAILGAGAAGVAALRGRWSDQEVALFLDARSEADETLTSAIASRIEDTERGAALRARAVSVLEQPRAPGFGPRWLRPFHALTLTAVVSGVLFTVLPSPRAASLPVKPAGTQLLQKKDVPGLARIEALEHAESLSEGDAERLRKLARDAKTLRSDLARGIEQREAQARLGRLRDEVESERQRFGDASERGGLEAAVNALAARESTRRAAKALEQGDVIAFDEEMQRLANRAESEAREQAREALEDAAERARQKGGKRLSDLLERQQKLLSEREKAARALRELAELLEGNLSAEQRQALEKFEQGGSPEASQKLAEALADALSGLTPEERQRLAAALRKRISAPSPKSEALDARELEELAKRISEAEGREALREALKELARQPAPDADRERALEDAERGGAEAERGLMPMPMPGSGPGQPGTRPGPPQVNDDGRTPGTTGPGGGDRNGEKRPGSDRAVPGAEELRAKANTQLLPGTPLETRALGRAPARAGETAGEVGTGALGNVGPKEVSAVENSDVPEEYREHVGRYFQP